MDKEIEFGLEELLKLSYEEDPATIRASALELNRQKLEQARKFEESLYSLLSYEQQQMLRRFERDLISEKQSELIRPMFESIYEGKLNLQDDQKSYVKESINRVLSDTSIGNYTLGSTIQRVQSNSSDFTYEIVPQVVAILDDMSSVLSLEQKEAINFDVLRQSMVSSQL